LNITRGNAGNQKALTKDNRVGQTKNNKKMKTLGKLKLKEEKMLNSEELLGFRGGSGSGCGGYTWIACISNYTQVMADCYNNCAGNCRIEWIGC
jgi:natural product precursor